MHGADGDNRFRVNAAIGRAPGAFLLREHTTGTRLWATLADTDDGTVWPGMVLRGRPVEREHCHRLTDVTVEATNSLAIGRCRDGIHQSVWDAWEQRSSGQRQVTTVLPGPCEVHVSVPPPGRDPEAVFERLLTGAVSFEPWFEGLVELDEPATHLTVVSPTERSPFVCFATPDRVPRAEVRRRRETLGVDPVIDE